MSTHRWQCLQGCRGRVCSLITQDLLVAACNSCIVSSSRVPTSPIVGTEVCLVMIAMLRTGREFWCPLYRVSWHLSFRWQQPRGTTTQKRKKTWPIRSNRGLARVSTIDYDFSFVVRYIIDSVFHNQSHADQIPVQDQVAIALYRFRHYGNGATIMKVALWAGIGFGTVRLVTNHVMKAVCSERFLRSALHWPDSDTKERAKAWVEEHSCPAWRDGWCMVDGTLIPLHAWPAWYGNTWFDRKSNYSLNVQVCDYDLS